jgi:DNA-binding beta-propeller fold protein YncE
LRTRLLAAALAAFTLTAGVARSPMGYRATGTLAAADFPYLPGSRILSRVDGFPAPYRIVLSGPGEIAPDGTYVAPTGDADLPGHAFLVAGNAQGLAARTIALAPAPAPDRSSIAVASYDDGLVLHDASNFSVSGILGTGGSPSDVAIAASGRIAVTDTQGSYVTLASMVPSWQVTRTPDVPAGDEVAIEESTGATFVTDRDFAGGGALTRIAADGTVTHVVTGSTPEGLAIDDRRHIVYVANVNDGTVAAVDAGTMRLIRRFRAVDRVFSLVLSGDGSTLYGVSNQSESSPFGAAGSTISMDVRNVRGRTPKVIARSARLTFPLGAALDVSTDTLFVTDESSDVVYVLDAKTLRPKRAPLPTCRTPWKPAFDALARRLYVPCARADRVDAFDTRTLHRIGGAPFATASYPLAVAVWHPARTINR